MRKYSIRNSTDLLILVIFIATSGFARQASAQHPILEYVGDWTGELTIQTKLVNGGETHEEWDYYIEPSFKIDELGCLTGTATVQFTSGDFSITGTKCEVAYPSRDEFPMAGGLVWIPGYEVYGTTDTLLGNIGFLLPGLPGSSASFKGTGECLKCTDKFYYHELPEEVLKILPCMLKGQVEEGESVPYHFSFANKTLIDLGKVEESLSIYCDAVTGNGKLVRPANTLALDFRGKWRSGGPQYFSEAKGTVWKEGEGEALRLRTKFKKWDKIVTGPNSSVKIKLGDVSGLSINGNTMVRFRSKNEIDVTLGEIYSKIKPGNNYKVRIPKTSACAVRGTQFITKVEGGTASVTVLDGQVEFSDVNKRKTVIVKKNQKSVCKTRGLPSEPEQIDSNKIQRWWDEIGETAVKKGGDA